MCAVDSTTRGGVRLSHDSLSMTFPKVTRATLQIETSSCHASCVGGVEVLSGAALSSGTHALRDETREPREEEREEERDEDASRHRRLGTRDAAHHNGAKHSGVVAYGQPARECEERP